MRQFVERLTQGEQIPLTDTSRPPWLEPGVVSEIAGEMYACFLKSQPHAWKRGHAFVSGASPLRLFWRRNGKFYGRELTTAEADRFIALCSITSTVDCAHRRKNEVGGQIRLACLYCNTQECDGITRIPQEWADVDEFQSRGQSTDRLIQERPAHATTEWYTHLGVCPDCQKSRGR
jgi:hypothetical protein